MNRKLLIMFLIVLIPVVILAQEWPEHIIEDDFAGASSVCAMDMDGDGDTDLFGAAASAAEIIWWENADGSGSSWVEHVVEEEANGARSLNVTDIDGDGDLDMLAAEANGNMISWWENDDGSGLIWTRHVVGNPIGGVRCVYSADMDGDGDTDVLSAGIFQNYMSWWENEDGAGTSWTEHTAAWNYDDMATSVSAADIDGDGDMDILGTFEIEDIWEVGYVVWWENVDGTGTNLSTHQITSTFVKPRSIYPADLDNDGDFDVLAGAVGGASQEDALKWWENVDGLGGSWSGHLVDNEYLPVEAVYAADINGDGDVDVLSGQTIAGVVWFENANGAGTSWTRYELDDMWTARNSVYAADVDDDRDIDVLAAGENTILWWEQPESPDPVEVTLTPTSQTDIPAAGGTLAFDANVVSNLPDTYPGVWFWTKVKLPNGNFYPQIQYQVQFALLPFMNVTGSLTQDIPDYAPEGNYEMWGWIGPYPNHPLQFGDFFPFTKSASAETQAALPTWAAAGGFAFDDAAATGEVLPSPVVLGAAHPNPFNSAATISIHLPNAAQVSVVVFNVTGRRVATLAEESFEAGTHTLAFDASHLASGLYFVRATVPGQLDEVRKVMLVR